MTLLISEQLVNIIYVFAVVAPTLAFLILLFVMLKKRMKVRIVSILQPIHIVGYMEHTTEEDFVKIDNAMWKKYRENRKTIPNRKEEFSFLSIRKASKEKESFDYYIGTIVNDLTSVPEGMVSTVVPTGTYAYVHIPVKSSKKWVESLLKAEHFVLKKWLPKSGFVINEDSEVYEMEYHDKRDEKNTRCIIFYVAIKQK